MHHVGRGYDLQRVTYEFEFQEKKYQGTFEAGQRLGKQTVGEFIKVKFSTKDPKRSKFIAFYKV